MTVKIISINVNHGGEQISELEKFILEEYPDITFIQEAYNSQDKKREKRLQTVQLFREWMSADHTAFFAAYHDGDVDSDRGNAIISNLPIVDSGGTVFNHPYTTIYNEADLGDWRYQPRVLQTATILCNKHQLNVLNVHGIWDFHGRDTELRYAQSKHILALAEHKSPLIIIGDFNMNPDTEAIHMLEKSYQPVFGNELKTTFNMRKKTNPEFSQAVVDLMFVTHDINIVSKKCPDVDISDHLPLIVEIEI